MFLRTSYNKAFKYFLNLLVNSIIFECNRNLSKTVHRILPPPFVHIIVLYETYSCPSGKKERKNRRKKKIKKGGKKSRQDVYYKNLGQLRLACLYIIISYTRALDALHSSSNSSFTSFPPRPSESFHVISSIKRTANIIYIYEF